MLTKIFTVKQRALWANLRKLAKVNTAVTSMFCRLFGREMHLKICVFNLFFCLTCFWTKVLSCRSSTQRFIASHYNICPKVRVSKRTPSKEILASVMYKVSTMRWGSQVSEKTMTYIMIVCETRMWRSAWRWLKDLRSVPALPEKQGTGAGSRTRKRKMRTKHPSFNLEPRAYLRKRFVDNVLECWLTVAVAVGHARSRRARVSSSSIAGRRWYLPVELISPPAIRLLWIRSRDVAIWRRLVFV